MEITYMSLWDWMLVPIYIIVIFLVLVAIKKKNPGNLLIQRYLLKGFFYKAFFAIMLCMLVYFYYGFGDTMSYFRDSMLMKQAIQNGEADLSILLQDFEYVSERFDFITGASASWIIVRLVIVVSYFCFNSFLVITIVFAAFTYAGMFRMFQAFTAMMPQQHFLVALLVLFFPSVTMYGSGIQKDSICIAALGCATYYLQLIFFQKKVKMKYVIFIIASCFLIGLIKIYIIAAFAIPCVFFMVISIVKKVESKIFRAMLLPLLLGVMLIAYLALAQKIQQALGNYATENLAATIAQQQ